MYMYTYVVHESVPLHVLWMPIKQCTRAVSKPVGYFVVAFCCKGNAVSWAEWQGISYEIKEMTLWNIN